MNSRFINFFKLNKEKKTTLQPKINFSLKKAIKGKKEKLEITTKENKYKKIMYTKKAKDLIKNTPGLLREIREYLEGKKYRPKVYTVFLDKEKVRLRIEEINRPSKNSILTNNFYKIEIKDGKEIHKFFVKKKKITTNTLCCIGTREMQALDIINQAGFNIIKPHFAYKIKGKESFIFYEYQDKIIDAEKAFLERKINSEDIKQISRKLNNLETRINDFIKVKYPNENFKITDISSNTQKNKHALPVFIDFENKKLFLFDPILSKN
ncbi:MAG: hypothetical protein PHX47_02070 [Candidatus ainarchaeum sp.]|nr:hypothetical protein [Candidatus ainarchaeum sp.]